MSCFRTECLALISLDALEASTTVDMLTTVLLILVLSSTYRSARRRAPRGRGQREGPRKKRLKKKPFISAPRRTLVWLDAFCRTVRLLPSHTHAALLVWLTVPVRPKPDTQVRLTAKRSRIKSNFCILPLTPRENEYKKMLDNKVEQQ